MNTKGNFTVVTKTLIQVFVQFSTTRYKKKSLPNENKIAFGTLIG